MKLKLILSFGLTTCCSLLAFGSPDTNCSDEIRTQYRFNEQTSYVSAKKIPRHAISIQFDARGRSLSVGDVFQLSGYKSLVGHPDHFLTVIDREKKSRTDEQLEQDLKHYAYEMADLAKTTDLSANELARIFFEGRLFIQLLKSKNDESDGRVWSVNMFERLPDDRLLYLNPRQAAKMNEFSIHMYNQIFVPSRKSVDMAAFRRGEPVIHPTQIYAVDIRFLDGTIHRAYGSIPIDYGNTRAYVDGAPGYVNLGRYPFLDIEGSYHYIDRTDIPLRDAAPLERTLAITALRMFNLKSLVVRPAK